MVFEKESLHDTNLPTLIIDRKKMLGLESEYPQIGHGEEGYIYKYNDRIALKVFEFYGNKNLMSQKFKKIESLATIRDESFCIPIGLFGYEDAKKEGYYMDLVTPSPEYKDFNDLKFAVQLLKLQKKACEYLKKADAAIQRIHKKGLIIGDIRGKNIMIDINDNPRFVDVDNYAFKDFDFDLRPGRADWLYRAFRQDGLPEDNDIFVFTLMCLDILVPSMFFSTIQLQSILFFNNFIKLINASSEVKDGLSLILSDAQNKPYFGEILEKIDFEQELISDEQASRLMRKYFR